MSHKPASGKGSGSAGVSVITGAGSGIGKHLALQLASDGVALALVDNDAAALACTADEIETMGARQVSWLMDMADRDSVAKLPQAVLAECGPPTALYNVAGVIMAGAFVDSELGEVERVLAVDLLGVIASCHAFLPHLEAAGSARLVNVSSAFGLIGVGGYSAYSAAKFGVRGFTEALMQEVSPHVQVSCAVLGGVRTNIMRNGHYARGADAASIQQRFDRRIARTSAEQAAAQILRQADKGRRHIVVGADAHAVAALVRLTGTRYQAVTRRLGSRSR